MRTAAAGIVVGFAFAALPFATEAPARIQFTDATRSAGLLFAHYTGKKNISTILEQMGPGVCVADFDGDGWVDIYIANGRDLHGGGVRARNALYRNNRDGTFTDVTKKAGVPGTGYGLGCVWGDYDNDGHPDLYVSQWGKNVLYRNRGDGTFEDVTAKTKTGALDFEAPFHSGAVFLDYDQDGLLDLYAGSYVGFSSKEIQYCLVAPGLKGGCPPTAYAGTPGILFHNNGDGTFTNVTREMGLYAPDGKVLAVQAVDYDQDGWPDLIMANDTEETFCFHNEKGKHFTNVAREAGIALDESGHILAGMNVDLGDYNNDGWLDLFITDFQDQPDHLWRNDRGTFTEVSYPAGIGTATVRTLGFGGGFLDYDNDGCLDLFVANGHIEPAVERVRADRQYKQVNQLFHNGGQGKFAEVTASAGPGFELRRAGRGVAFLDYDNDGNMDILVGNNGDPPLLLHNSGGSGNHFVTFRLVGTRGNRDAVHAKLRLYAGGLFGYREIRNGGSYMSHSDSRAHFGLGASNRVDRLEVVWPGGQRQQFSGIAADHFYVITEGHTELRIDPGDPRGPVRAPVGLPPVVWPKDNPYSLEKWELGRTLFFDPRLSVDGSVSCGTCHNPKFAFTDGQAVSRGVNRRTGIRNAPTIVNQVYTLGQDWDGHAPTLEEQASGPLTNPVEMGNTVEGVVRALRGIAGYAPMFTAAFGTPEIDMRRITQAIATFERSVLSGNSAYDRFKAGDKSAMTPSQIRGTMVFYGRGRCDECHNGLNLSANGSFDVPYRAEFHNLGVGMNKNRADEGRYQVTGNPRDWGAFKTPTLREIASTAPYMHDGSLKTLEEVVDFYDQGGATNRNLDPLMKPLHLSVREKRDLVEFLKGLSGEGWRQIGPPGSFPR